MTINRKGCTRIVIEFSNVVVKIPNPLCQWDHFLKGLIANIQESRTWKWNSGKYESGKSRLLCPVLWCSWGGWLLIQKRVHILSYSDEFVTRDDPYQEWIDNGLGGDDKPDNYGYLDGRIVKVDYGQ